MFRGVQDKKRIFSLLHKAFEKFRRLVGSILRKVHYSQHMAIRKVQVEKRASSTFIPPVKVACQAMSLPLKHSELAEEAGE